MSVFEVLGKVFDGLIAGSAIGVMGGSIYYVVDKLSEFDVELSLKISVMALVVLVFAVMLAKLFSWMGSRV